MDATVTYRIEAHYPRQWDQERHPGRIGFVHELTALEDVVDATFPDLTASWSDDGDPAAPFRESRRQLAIVITRSTARTPPAAEERATAALLRVLSVVAAHKRHPDDVVTVNRARVEVYTV